MSLELNDSKEQSNASRQQQQSKLTSRTFTRLELTKKSKDELIDIILSHPNLKRSFHEMNEHKQDIHQPSKKRKKLQKQINFSDYNQRRIALKFAYFGDNYNGFIIQESSNNTIEKHLIDALLKCRLIESIESCNPTISGRTDKGVSAFGNVYVLNVRCNSNEGIGVIRTKKTVTKKNKPELNYMKMLNAVLPIDIRIISYAFVHEKFSARFNCKGRIYKYLFYNDNMNIQEMKKAANLLIGKHDYRNFCKMDVINVRNFVREIRSVSIESLGLVDEEKVDNVYSITIAGTAFLWHQIRCTISILLRIGKGLETSDLITKMLDVEKCGGKPIYKMASCYPLILWDCLYDEKELNFPEYKQESARLFFEWHQLWRLNHVKSIKQKLLWKQFSHLNLPDGIQFAQLGDKFESGKKKKHVSLMDGPREHVYEDKIKNLKNGKLKRYNAKEEKILKYKDLNS